MPNRTQSAGTLFVVATPIGNLSDMSERAREVLGTVELIAAEDTRHTSQMLTRFGIDTPLMSLHEHNEESRTSQLIVRLVSGENIALVSDAGTPLVSDPGFALVRSAIESKLRVVSVPGPCAAIAALTVSGLPTDRFVFEGFLPAKAAQRRERLIALSRDWRTLVVYEAPHRLVATLTDMAAVFAARRIAVARELTKQFETMYYGTATELAEQAQSDVNMTRGELVIVVAGAKEQASTATNVDEVLSVLISELSPAQAAKLAARLTGAKRDALYRRALELNGTKS